MGKFNPFALPDDIWSLPKSDLVAQIPEESLFQRDLEKLLQLDSPFEITLNPKTESLFASSPWGELFPPLSFPQRDAPPQEPEPLDSADVDSGLGAGDDPWLDVSSTSSNEKGQLISWETFLSQRPHNRANPFVTEARYHVIDAMIQRYDDDGTSEEPPKNIIQTDVLIYCLLHLVQGWDSMLFKFNEQKGEFEMAKEDIRLSGTSVGLTQNLILQYLKCGNRLRALQAFAKTVYGDIGSCCKTRVGLAHCIRIITVAVQNRLAVLFTNIQSVLQLDDIIRVPTLILEALLKIVERVKDARLDFHLLSATFEQIQQSEYKSDWLRHLLLLMLQRITRPWLTMVSKAIGVTVEKTPFVDDIFGDESFFIELGDSVLGEGEEEPHADLIFASSNIPSFLMLEEAERIHETSRGLRLLRRFHPNHPLLSDHAVERVNMRWSFSWDELQTIDLEAAAHEKRLQLAMQAFNFTKRPRFSRLPVMQLGIYDGFSFDFIGKSEEEINASLAASLENMNFEPQRVFGFEGAADDNLGNEALTVEPITSNQPVTARYPPPLSVTFSLSINPILQAQARLTNMACMRLLFKEKRVQNQYELLHSFLLFGDGVYVSRLSAALFSEELASGTTNSGIRSGIAAGGWGLQLGVRNDWPPASSELRLALMGIMAECYAGGIGKGTGHKENDDLPGGLSFSVREMTEEEEDKCKNPDSLEALDFLQVSYRPKSPYDAVIDSVSLVKYDRLFKHLLRMIRMVYVVNRLFEYTNIGRGKEESATNPIILRFRIEAHFFVSTLAKYMFETGVETVWKEFAKKLDEIERRLEKYDISDRYGEMESLGQLAAYHNSCLDQMLFATMLRLRQQPVLNLIEEIFGMVLKFAKMVRLQHIGAVDPLTPMDNSAFGKLYGKFRKRVGIFINVARALSERRGYGGLAKRESDRSKDAFRGPGDAAEGGALGQLLVKLEMSTYYVDAAKKL
ncbi:hypothetical protein TWF481_005937 [Arthrobotrys musiformis]|uniref:Spindle pole body component n=1 Tax=Arthrobotrys musiformis TaxID=47236 RepID=A0AAV9WFA1_9PEZI